jgi:hypothetical protein
LPPPQKNVFLPFDSNPDTINPCGMSSCSTSADGPAPCLAAMEVRRKHADAKATELEPIIAEIRAAGTTTLRKALNARGIPTVRGKVKWRRLGVKRVLARLKAQGFAAPTSQSSEAAVDSLSRSRLDVHVCLHW